MKVIRNGKVCSWVQGVLIVFGVLLIYLAIFEIPSMFKAELNLVFFYLGLIILAVGGYSAQASTLQIRPFGNLTFPRDKEGETPKEAGVFEKILNSILFIIIVTPFVLAVIDDTNKPLSENYGLMKIYLGVIFSFVIVYWGRKIYGKKQSKDKQDDSNR